MSVGKDSFVEGGREVRRGRGKVSFLYTSGEKVRGRLCGGSGERGLEKSSDLSLETKVSNKVNRRD